MSQDKISTDRILSTLRRQEGQYGGSADISEYQVACVLKAMADHTLIMEMLAYKPEENSPWPEATSVGRWIHSAADELFDKQNRSI